jgi:predicted O-methyltransferase YrrM
MIRKFLIKENYRFFIDLIISIKPIQIKEEIIEFLNYITKIKVNIVLEIGTANGGTFFLFSRIANRSAELLSIDCYPSSNCRGYPDYKIPLYRSFACSNQKVHLLRANSHDPKTLESIKRILEGKKIDLIFIDGDHSYDGVKKDFKMYFPLVREGGIIAFHDIAPRPKESPFQVDRFWNEIKEEFKYIEIGNKDHGIAGIGILFV